jgi:hypothetical protein
MINFYGLEVRSGERTTVNRAQNFATKATVWLSPGSANARLNFFLGRPGLCLPLHETSGHLSRSWCPLPENLPKRIRQAS